MPIVSLCMQTLWICKASVIIWLFFTFLRWYLAAVKVKQQRRPQCNRLTFTVWVLDELSADKISWFPANQASFLFFTVSKTQNVEITPTETFTLHRFWSEKPYNKKKMVWMSENINFPCYLFLFKCQLSNTSHQTQRCKRTLHMCFFLR